jgi:methylphosphotriester-DNA--protein-cysteine methyltransferase
MEKEISELAYKDTASMTKKEKMNGMGIRLFFFRITGIIVSVIGRVFQANPARNDLKHAQKAPSKICKTAGFCTIL